MSIFDESIPGLLERHIEEAKKVIENKKISRTSKLADLDKSLSEDIAHWEGRVEALKRLTELKWDHYAKVHLDNK